jgi:hypothetical protein
VGLSIHFQGKIKSYELISEMMIEVEDICKSMGWQYQLLEPKNKIKTSKSKKPVKYTPHDVKGICFTPPESETVSLTFLPDATLVCPAKLIYYDPATNDLMIECIHVKTQFAGPELHIALLKLLRYLRDKYFESFELNDEGEYWDKWDENVLKQQFSKYNFLLDSVAEALSGMKAVPGETTESLADRIEAVLKKKFKDMDDQN